MSNNVRVPNDDKAKKEDEMTNDQTEHKRMRIPPSQNLTVGAHR